MSRIDSENFPSAIRPNRWVPAVSCVVWWNNRVVLQKRRDTEKWGLPGGGMEFGESIMDTVRREISEETGLTVTTIRRLVGIYSNPRHIIAYTDGEIRQEFAIVVECTAEGHLKADGQESLAVKAVSREEALNWALDPRHLQRLRDALTLDQAVIR